MVHSTDARSLSWGPLVLFALAATTVVAFSAWLASSPFYLRAPQALSYAIATDLTLTLGALCAYLAVKRGGAPAALVAPVVLAGAALACRLLPAPPRGLVYVLAGALALALSAAILRRARRLVVCYRARRQDGAAPRAAMRSALADVASLPDVIARLVADEFAMVRAVTVGWRDANPPADQVRTFTHHSTQGWGAMIGVLALATAAETIAVSALVVMLLPTWSALLTALHLVLVAYTVIWLAADWHALVRGRLTIEEGALEVELGRRFRTSIPLACIEDVRRGEPQGQGVEFEGRRVITRKLEGYRALVAFGSATMHVVLREPVIVEGPIGITLEARIIGLAPDELDAFVEALTTRGDLP